MSFRIVFFFWFFMFHISFHFSFGQFLYLPGEIQSYLWFLTYYVIHNWGNGPRNFDIPPLNNWLGGREDSSFCHSSPYFKKMCLYCLWKNLLMAIGRSDKKKTSHSFLDRNWRYWRMDLGLGSLEQWQTDLSWSGWQ